MRATLGGLWPICFLILGLMEGCRCSGGLGPCDQNPPLDGCGQACTTAPDNCPAGLYCDATSNQCTADCSATSSCPANETCTTDGRCVASSGDGSMADGGGTMDGCANINLTTTQAVPSVITIVDQSLSMNTTLATSTATCSTDLDCATATIDNPELTPNYFCNGGNNCAITRWDALEDALVGSNTSSGTCTPRTTTTSGGLLFDMQDRVRFGLAFYTTPSTSSSTCAETTAYTYAPNPLNGVAVNNYESLKSTYDCLAPLGRTPTERIINAVRTNILASPPPAPIVFILATDGQPNCAVDTTPDAVQRVVDEIALSLTAGIPTYVVGLGGNDSGLNANLQLFADAGDASGTGTLYVPTDPAALQAALQGIIGAQISCDMSANGAIMDPTKGTVMLNGRTILYTADPGAASGWTATPGGSTITILGTDCDELKGTPNSTVNASFPCGAACYLEFC